MRSLSLFTDKIYSFCFVHAQMSFRINFKAARNQRVGYILLFMDILGLNFVRARITAVGTLGKNGYLHLYPVVF